MSDKGLPSLFERHWAESVLAIGAIIIAAVSLWVAYSIEQTNQQLVAAQHQLVTENAWPFVEQSSNNEHGSWTTRTQRVDLYTVTNAGVGPAKLESAELSWHGKGYSSWPALAHACCGYTLKHPAVQMGTNPLAGRVLRPGQSVVTLLYPRTPADSATWRELTAKIRSARFKLCYCSVFDQCWLTSRETLRPKPVRICPVAKVPYSG